MHIQRHTHTSTYEQSAHKRNHDNQAQEPGWEGRKKDRATQSAARKTVPPNRFENDHIPAIPPTTYPRPCGTEHHKCVWFRNEESRRDPIEMGTMSVISLYFWPSSQRCLSGFRDLSQFHTALWFRMGFWKVVHLSRQRFALTTRLIWTNGKNSKRKS